MQLWEFAIKNKQIKHKTNKQTKKSRGNPKKFQLINRTNLVSSALKRFYNKSGVIGVSWDKAAQKWVARFDFQGHLILNSVYVPYEGWQ